MYDMVKTKSVVERVDLFNMKNTDKIIVKSFNRFNVDLDQNLVNTVLKVISLKKNMNFTTAINESLYLWLLKENKIDLVDHSIEKDTIIEGTTL